MMGKIFINTHIEQKETIIAQESKIQQNMQHTWGKPAAIMPRTIVCMPRWQDITPTPLIKLELNKKKKKKSFVCELDSSYFTVIKALIDVILK